MATPKRITRAVTLTAIIILLAVASLAQAEEDDEVLARVLADLERNAAHAAAEEEAGETEPALTWTCYANPSDATHDRKKVIFTAYKSVDGAHVVIHGEREPAVYERTGLNVEFWFGTAEDGDHWGYQLIISPDGKAEYRDATHGFNSFVALYFCVKSEGKS